MLVLREYLRSQLAELGIAEQRRILPYVVASFVRMGGGWTGRALLVGREALLALLVAMHLVLHHFGQPGFRLPSGQQMRPPCCGSARRRSTACMKCSRSFGLASTCMHLRAVHCSSE